MRVIFIVPPYGNIYGSFRSILKRGFLNPPLGLCYLAACLKKAGHEVRIIDSEAEGYMLEDIVKTVKLYLPDLIGITATSPEFINTSLIARALKETSSTPIVLGGAHISIVGKEALEKNSDFDFGVIGEAEQTIVELSKAIEDKASFSAIKGLIYRQEDGTVVQTDTRQPMADLDEVPFPARNLLEDKKYFRSIPRKGYVTTTAFVSSRGCPYHCVYCAVDKLPGANRIRFRSPKNIVDEIELIVNEMGIKHISFNDDVLTLNKDRILKVCDGIMKRKIKFTWEGLSRADAVDKELLTFMKRAGLVRISFGIESGNPGILKMVKKGLSHKQLRKAFSMARKAGIVTRGSVIIGLPYETQQTVKETTRFVKRLYGLDQLIVNISTPYPGTKLREMVLAGEGGTKLLDPDISALQRFGNAVLEVNDLTKEDLINLQKEILLSFYLSPPKLFRNLIMYEFKALLQDSFSLAASLFKRNNTLLTNSKK
ncbi:MAG: cobalamin-dependent protein [Candidatus Omnitrophica bacterium]|nr:cobalamin-dependent protein [Candidatus Omnitrophota bacterium]